MAGALLLLAPGMTTAQEEPSVLQMLEGFERDRGEVIRGPSLSPAEWVQRTLVFSADYRAERVDSVIDGLLSLAASDDAPWARVPAVVWTASLGRADRPGGEPWPRVFERLEELYWDLAERRELIATVAIVRAVPHLAVDESVVLRFLEDVLTSFPRSHAYPTPRDAAIAGLGRMGPEGKEVLCRVLGYCGNDSDDPAPLTS